MIIQHSQSLTLHDKHLGSVSATTASCFALGCWNGRKARVLFITVLLGKAQWKKCLCLGGLDAARSHQYFQQNIKVTPMSYGDHDLAQQRLVFHKHIGL